MRNIAEAVYYFHEGTSRDAYRFLGAHKEADGDGFRYLFRVWAPRADSVWLVGDFFDWEGGVQMTAEADGEIYTFSFSSSADLEGAAYKFRIEKNGKTVYKGDPYAFSSRGGSDGASILTDPTVYRWGDAEYLATRRASFSEVELSLPINIYEVHLGSFARREDGSYLGYAELAELLLSYAKYMGYTHIELLPVTEYPYDASWGYQVCGYFAPTSRFGTPQDFCAFVDRLHSGGVGVILDWVPAHFPKDEWGLYEFDGAPLYEYTEEWRREARSWGTRYFDLGRREVKSFLISSALFWLREYHIDGLRVDAVSSMLYLDYDRSDGEWERNIHGTNISLEAEAFFRSLSSAVSSEVPDALLIAEESTAYPGVTERAENGGLGFRLKWNMGFSNDLFAYLSLPKEERKAQHTALTFPIAYAFSERYILPISHDEVVHGKRAFLNKARGSYEEKLATCRAALLFIMTFPGKKLLFMGTEYGQIKEWNYDAELDWQLLDSARHDALREYVASLNRLYLSSPALYERDFSEEGFFWILADESERELVAFLRRSGDGEELVVAVSFSEEENREIRLPLSRSGSYRVVFATGETGEPDRIYETEGTENVLTLTLPPTSGMVLARCEEMITL